mgnify:CR=1 FL=1
MKRLMSLLLMLCLLIPCLTAPALADTPKPIPTIDYDSIPEPREGLHHYLLLCSDQWTNKLVNTDGIVIVTASCSRRLSATRWWSAPTA